MVGACVIITAASCLLLDAEKKNKETNQKKKKWIKEYRKTRENIGNTQHFMWELKSDPLDYRNILRMNEECFNFLLAAIKTDIEKQDTRMRNAISPGEKLAITLRFLATGQSFKDLDYNSKLSAPFLSKAILEVCEAIYKNLKDEFVKFPTTKEEWIKISDDFSLKWQFPNCIGALDGKHIAFRPSKKNAGLFYNYKGFHSIVLLALADAYGKFIFIDVGCNGRISDGGVLNRSNFNYILQQPDKFLPSKKMVGNSRLLPYVVVADNAFRLSENMMTPYSYSTKEITEKIFNYRLSRARQVIECAFGILANRFRIFQTTINLREEKVKKIVLCCCVLHNFLITNSRRYSETDNSNSSEENIALNQKNSEPGENVRQEFLKYFNDEGRI